MGCDIHFHIERRTPTGWEQDDLVGYKLRTYPLFAALADVRNEWGIVPVADPRGLPDDLSRSVREQAERWQGSLDDHSHSWLTFEELAAYDGWDWKVEPGGWSVAGPDWRAIMERMKDLAGDDPTSVRAVFWFDS